MSFHEHFFSLSRDSANSSGAKADNAKFRMTNFIYSAASTAVWRQKLEKLIGGLDDAILSKTALVVALIEPVFSDG